MIVFYKSEALLGENLKMFPNFEDYGLHIILIVVEFFLRGYLSGNRFRGVLVFVQKNIGVSKIHTQNNCADHFFWFDVWREATPSPLLLLLGGSNAQKNSGKSAAVTFLREINQKRVVG